MNKEVFLDTAYVLALSSPHDDFHAQAKRLAARLATEKTRFVTTHAVLLEIGNALAKQRYRAAAVKLLAVLESDPNVEIMLLSQRLYTKAVNLYQDRSDKEWGLTDCVSFVVMQERRMTEALTTDEHFQQAGFRALLREEQL